MGEGRGMESLQGSSRPPLSTRDPIPDLHGSSSLHRKVLLGRSQSRGSWLRARAVQVKARGPRRPGCQSPGGSGRMLDRGLVPKASLIFCRKRHISNGLISPLLSAGKKPNLREPTARGDVYLPNDRTPRDYFWILL